MKVISYVIIFITMSITGCATTITKIYHAAGAHAICDEKGHRLAHIAVLPETAWRSNQKDTEKRELMALEEITKVFQGIPCGNISTPGGIMNFLVGQVYPSMSC